MYTTSTIFDVTEIRSELRPVMNGGYVRELRIQDTYNNLFAIQLHGESALRLELPEGGQAQLRRIAEREAEKYLTVLARIYALDEYATLADARQIVAEYLDVSELVAIGWPW
jgi:hypothetical protein